MTRVELLVPDRLAALFDGRWLLLVDRRLPVLDVDVELAVSLLDRGPVGAVLELISLLELVEPLNCCICGIIRQLEHFFLAVLADDLALFHVRAGETNGLELQDDLEEFFHSDCASHASLEYILRRLVDVTLLESAPVAENELQLFELEQVKITAVFLVDDLLVGL